MESSFRPESRLGLKLAQSADRAHEENDQDDDRDDGEETRDPRHVLNSFEPHERRRNGKDHGNAPRAAGWGR